MMQAKNNKIINIASVMLMILVIIMPFHAALVTIIGAHISFKSILQAWKELLIGIIFLLSFFAYIKDRSLFKFDSVNITALIIVLFSLIISILTRPGYSALLAGIKTNLVVLILFISVQVLAKKFDLQLVTKLILYPAAVVVVLAILQPWLFTPSVLANLGYNQGSIVPGQYIESSLTTLRVFSTLGGPNQLGAYLIIPATLSLALVIRKKQFSWLSLYVLASVALYMTHSRSALIGFILASVLVVVLSFTKKTQLIILISTVLIAIATMITFSKVNFCTQFPGIATKLIHGDCNNGILGGSDLQHINALKSGFEKIAHQPIGYGLGTAGPASYYTPKPLIVENWYLQIAIEIGVLGLILYIVFFVLLLKKLYISSQANNQDSVVSLALVAVIAGVLTTGFFLHSLADSTLSIVLFALLGLQNSRIAK